MAWLVLYRNFSIAEHSTNSYPDGGYLHVAAGFLFLVTTIWLPSATQECYENVALCEITIRRDLDTAAGEDPDIDSQSVTVATADGKNSFYHGHV